MISLLVSFAVLIVGYLVYGKVTEKFFALMLDYFGRIGYNIAIPNFGGLLYEKKTGRIILSARHERVGIQRLRL